MSDLLNECVNREAERQRPYWGDGIDDPVERGRITREVAAIVADVLDILSTDGRLHPTLTTPADQGDNAAGGGS